MVVAFMCDGTCLFTDPLLVLCPSVTRQVNDVHDVCDQTVEPSISQLIDAMGQDQLEVLKESAEKCLDLQMSKETPPAMVKDEVPVTQWEAERKKEQGEDVFMVPANILVIPPEEEAVACDASKADTCEAAPGKSSDERIVPGDPGVISQASSEQLRFIGLGVVFVPVMPSQSPSHLPCLCRLTGLHVSQALLQKYLQELHVAEEPLQGWEQAAALPKSTPPDLIFAAAESTAFSESSEGSLDNPWNRLPQISLTLNSSDERTSQHDVPPKTQQDVAADSNTPDLLEQCSQDAAEGLPPGQPVQASSPSLLCPYGSISPVETGTTRAPAAAEAASDAPCPPRSLEIPEGSPATPSSLSPAFSITPSSLLHPLPEGTLHREQADSSGTAFPPDTLKRGPAGARTRGGGALGAKRKLLAGDDGQVLPGLGRQQHPRGSRWGRGRETGRRLELVSTRRTKKSRKEETGLQHGRELEEEEEEEEEEQAAPLSGPSSRPEQHRALQPYVKEKRAQYRYEAPSPELCERIRSVRISKAMLKWACWILTDGEVDS
ncbi:hypothetical protein llap_18932 [Limosa lapponica baueri]|uniref:Uncharacterized protein n=1 Tax=Limosa lapponica baueri TaxID=1758121 RepID=A0A2I0TAD2_LIMLA|nr:hypothetical protein llap_18932 [Limosa lapponica baueri]